MTGGFYTDKWTMTASRIQKTGFNRASDPEHNCRAPISGLAQVVVLNSNRYQCQHLYEHTTCRALSSCHRSERLATLLHSCAPMGQVSSSMIQFRSFPYKISEEGSHRRCYLRTGAARRQPLGRRLTDLLLQAFQDISLTSTAESLLQ